MHKTRNLKIEHSTAPKTLSNHQTSVTCRNLGNLKACRGPDIKSNRNSDSPTLKLLILLLTPENHGILVALVTKQQHLNMEDNMEKKMKIMMLSLVTLISVKTFANESTYNETYYPNTSSDVKSEVVPNDNLGNSGFSITTENQSSSAIWITIYDPTGLVQLDYGCVPRGQTRHWAAGNYLPHMLYQVRAQKTDADNCESPATCDFYKWIQLDGIDKKITFNSWMPKNDCRYP